MKTKAYNKNLGFTITELLVVIAIVAILSAFMVINFRKAEDSHKLQRSAQLIVQGIRDAQNMALSSIEVGGKVYDYYGAYFERNNYFYIFASENKVYNSGEDVKTINLEDGIIINSISTGSSLNIIFLPPYAFVEFNPSATSVTITIKKETGTCPQDCRYIKVNDKGMINITTTP